MASSDDNDDDEIDRAIALSLTGNGENSPNESGDEDEDLRRALALSLRDSASFTGKMTSTNFDSVSHSPTASSVSDMAPRGSNTAQSQADSPSISTPMATNIKVPGLLGIDRKAMEQERLARLRKRKRSASPDRPAKLIANNMSKSLATQKDQPSESQSSKNQIPKAQSSTDKCSRLTGIQFPKGVIKRTWAHQHSRTNDITIEEILQAATVNIAVLSAFQWDNVWLFDKLDPYRTKQIWIMSAKGDDVRKKLLEEAVEAKIPNFKAHFPPMPGQVTNMHSKLMLLFHETHLRIAVPTANMIKFDWGETNKDSKTGKSWQSGVMENSVFLIDLPRRLDGKRAKEAETAFGRELVQYLTAQELPQKVVEGVLKFSFIETEHLGFVSSIGGSHSSSSRNSTGLNGLAHCVRRLKLDQVEKLEVDYAASSLGALKEPFLKQIYHAACGLSPLTEKAQPELLDRVRIYFPTKETVTSSTGGADCGGIITLGRAHYNAPTFPRQCLRDYKSTRPGVLSHNKLLFARGRRKDGTAFAWVYIGSANMSESAWGAQKILKNGKEGVLSIRNWECGVVVPVPGERLLAMELSEGQVPPMSVFEGTVEVPFQYPGEKYDGNEPWFFRD